MMQNLNFLNSVNLMKGFREERCHQTYVGVRSEKPEAEIFVKFLIRGDGGHRETAAVPGARKRRLCP